MQGDGKTSYDVGKDGVPTMIMTSDITDAHEYALFASCLYPPSYLTQPQPLLEYHLCCGIFCYSLRR